MPTPMPEPQPATDPEFDSDMDSTYNHTGTSETAVEVDAGFPLAWYGGGIPTTPLEHRPRLKLKLPSPPPQGETFMVVFNPYPQYARMEFAEDVERMARWLGSIVHPTYFNAFYYKPSVSTVFRSEAFLPLALATTRGSKYSFVFNTCACGPYCPRWMAQLDGGVTDAPSLFSGAQCGHHKSLKVRTWFPLSSSSPTD